MNILLNNKEYKCKYSYEISTGDTMIRPKPSLWANR